MSRAFEIGKNLIAFHCPGCKYDHAAGVNGRKIPGSDGSMNSWQWNGSLDRPTFKPSLFVNQDGSSPSPRCHSFVTDGQIQFVGGTTHSLAGQTVDLPDWDTW